MDTVDQIAAHDPQGDRFAAAHLFIDLASPGDQIGSLRISSSSDSTGISGYHPLTTMDAAGKESLKQTLTAQKFGPVELNAPAYITPPLQAAGAMLQHAAPGNQKYVIIVTDAVAYSADNDSCTSAPAAHKWFCEVSTLEQEGVSVVLVGFTKPGAESELAPTASFIQSQGGIVLQVEDGAGLFQRLARNYVDLLTRIHSNTFAADVSGAPSTITLDPRDRLIGATLVALGDGPISFTNLRTPDGTDVTKHAANDQSYYSAAEPGYALESVRTGNLGGKWQLDVGGAALSDLIVIGVSEANFTLMNPAPARSTSAVSVRYIPNAGAIALRATMEDDSGAALPGLQLTADPATAAEPLTSNGIPGAGSATVGTVIDSSALVGVLQIGLGSPVAPGAYLTKSYEVVASADLPNVTLAPIATAPLAVGAGVTVTAQLSPGATPATATQVAEYARTPGSDSAWQQLSSAPSGSATPPSATFIPTHSCGYTYTLAAVAEVKGSGAMGDYDYLSVSQSPYTPQLQQEVTSKALLTSDPYLEWWPSQAHWTISFSSTECSNVPASIGVGLTGLQPTSPVVVESGEGYSVTSGRASFIVASNTTSQLHLVAATSGCGWSLTNDHPGVLTLTLAQASGGSGSVIQTGDWQTGVACPSVVTNARRYWPVTGLSLLFLSIGFSRTWWWFYEAFGPKKRLVGNIKVAFDVSDPMAPEPASPGGSNQITIAMPSYPSSVWYLARLEGDDREYKLHNRESSASILKFGIHSDGDGTLVTIRAVGNAPADRIPILADTQAPIEGSDTPYDGRPIIVGQDTLYPNFTVE